MNILCNSYEEEKVLYDKWAELEVNGEKFNFRLADAKNILELTSKADYSIDYMPIELHNRIYYLFTRGSKLFVTPKLNKVWRRKAKLSCRATKKYIKFSGTYTDISKRFPDCDNVYLGDEIATKIKRPFKFGFFKNYAVIKIPYEAIKKAGQVHCQVSIGDSKGNKMDVNLNKKHKGINYFVRRSVGDDFFLVRSVISSARIRIVNIPMSPEYKKINLFKNAIALFLSKFIGHTDSALLFEKETRKANESGYYVFEEIMRRKDVKSKVYFVIDKNCPDFNKVYSKYPNNTIIKYSFKHYLYIYISKYFISSELSNHVINPRLYIRSINNEISKKPLVFLQHGIMFAKPVDNPAAAGFKKSNSAINFFKCVVSSDLEASQFHILGFNNSDLIKCGLPKFDISKMDEKADKILIMLTYRYWEEALVMNPETITKTTYYNAYMEILDALEKEGLLDKVLISCHPKFAECIIKAAPKYEPLVEKDINKALENAKIFITDYSSASYDAHYRGAYVIYNWKERDYLIENYKAIPPVNDDNCDGVPTFSTEELVNEIKKAIDNNFVMDPMYEERYRKINEFHDGKNGERLVDALVELNII